MEALAVYASPSNGKNPVGGMAIVRIMGVIVRRDAQPNRGGKRFQKINSGHRVLGVRFGEEFAKLTNAEKGEKKKRWRWKKNAKAGPQRSNRHTSWKSPH